MNNYIKIIDYIKEFFKNDYSGHDFWHTYRVYQNALSISKKEKCRQELVILGALLHDVDDYKIVGKNNSYKNAKKILTELNYDKEVIDKVIHIISQVSFKGTDSVKPDTIEGMIVQDADRLDAIGAIGIARVFAYGGNHNRVIYDPNSKHNDNMNSEEYYNNVGSSINHFYEKLLKLKDLMNTKTAKSLAVSRSKYMEKYLDEFYKEWEGLK